MDNLINSNNEIISKEKLEEMFLNNKNFINENLKLLNDEFKGNEKFNNFYKNILKTFLDQNNNYFLLLFNKITDLNKESLDKILYINNLINDKKNLTEENNNLIDKKSKFKQYKKNILNESNEIKKKNENLIEENNNLKNENNILLKEKDNNLSDFNEIKEKNKNLNKEINKLYEENKKLKNLEKKNNDLNNEIDKLKEENKKIKILDKKNIDLKKEIDKLNEENKKNSIKLDQIINVHHNTINAITKEINLKNEKIDQLEIYNKNLNQTIKNKEKEIEELNNKLKEIDELKKDIEKKNKFFENFKGKFDTKLAEDFYDVIINIKSITEITKGWEIKFNSKKGKEEYDKMIKEEVLKVGVIGNGNKGKSFFLSKISDYELPTGTSIRTEGLSLKYPDTSKNERTIVLMDSAGLETPLLKNDNIDENNNNYIKNLEELAKDKTMTELFIQNFVINESDILICVVGILTYNEQKLINRIKSELNNDNNNNKDRKLFIIHNLQTYVEINQVEKYIKEYLLNSITFNLKKVDASVYDEKKNDKINKIFFSEIINNDKNNLEIYHFIMANENSDAGNFYNNFVIEYFKDLYKTIPYFSKFPVIEKIQNFFKDISNLFIENEIKNFDFDNNENNNLIKLNLNEKITLKKCLIDELGINILLNKKFIPKYCYFINKDNTKLIIEIEISGKFKNLSVEIISKENFYSLKIEGIKIAEILNKNNDYYNSRFNGYFNFIINVPKDKIELENSNRINNLSHKNGIIKIECDLIKEKKILTLDNNE